MNVKELCELKYLLRIFKEDCDLEKPMFDCIDRIFEYIDEVDLNG